MLDGFGCSPGPTASGHMPAHAPSPSMQASMAPKYIPSYGVDLPNGIQSASPAPTGMLPPPAPMHPGMAVTPPHPSQQSVTPLPSSNSGSMGVLTPNSLTTPPTPGSVGMNGMNPSTPMPPPQYQQPPQPPGTPVMGPSPYPAAVQRMQSPVQLPPGHFAPGYPGPHPHRPMGPHQMVPGDPPQMVLGPGGRPTSHPQGHPMQQPVHFFRRPPNPYVAQSEYRICDLNRKLQMRAELNNTPAPPENESLWWEQFTTEFFEDDAQMTFSFALEDGPKKYTIGRTLIPRYFRSMFEGGVSEMYLQVRCAKESLINGLLTLDCERAAIVTQHVKPMLTKVVTEGRLVLEFSLDEGMRIRHWHFMTSTHTELIPRAFVSQPEPAVAEQMAKNMTHQGLTANTLHFLRLCVILEPMQELMSRNKAYGLNPRDCLKTTLFQKWQRMVAPPEDEAPSGRSRKRDSNSQNNPRQNQTKRRKRKGSAAAGAGSASSTPGSKQKRSPGNQSFNPVPGDVMVVGEPALMGGEFGDEDERLITRLENSQHDPAAETGRTPSSEASHTTEVKPATTASSAVDSESDRRSTGAASQESSAASEQWSRPGSATPTGSHSNNVHSDPPLQQSEKHQNESADTPLASTEDVPAENGVSS